MIHTPDENIQAELDGRNPKEGERRGRGDPWGTKSDEGTLGTGKVPKVSTSWFIPGTTKYLEVPKGDLVVRLH